MKKLTLALSLVLWIPALHVAPASAELAPIDQQTAARSLDELFASWSTPEPQDLGTYITWSGGTCTAWLFCPGEPYWKCQSTSGNCQHDGCSITCNGNTRSCQNPCTPF
jgi:hypothetical protein